MEDLIEGAAQERKERLELTCSVMSQDRAFVVESTLVK